MDRVAWLKAGLPVDRPGVEIGPLDRPIMSRPGTAVLYADHLDQAGLREKYALHAPVNAATIPEIDFVIGAEGLSAGIAARNLAYFLASHVIEHIPNPIRWLREIHEMLADGGQVVLAIPDMRRCFDALRRPSSTAEWIDAYVENRARPSASRVFDALSNEVQLNREISWGHDPDPRDLILSRTPAVAYEIALELETSGEYMDVHCWTFTPDTFCNLMRALAWTGLLPLKLATITDTHAQEFLVRLVRDDAADQATIASSYPARGGRYELLPDGFDGQRYYAANPDVKAAGMDPYDHYLQYGRHENRDYG